MPREYKIIFSGSMGAGKTTAIQALSEVSAIKTDVTNTDKAQHSKETTTVAMDYGEITLEGGDRLRLYGTPGQARFDFMWKILAKGALGLIVLVDNSREDPVNDMLSFIDSFGEILARQAVVVGVGRCETHPVPTIDDYYAALSERNINIPLFSCDVRKAEDVLMLVQTLLSIAATLPSDLNN